MSVPISFAALDVDLADARGFPYFPQLVDKGNGIDSGYSIAEPGEPLDRPAEHGSRSSKVSAFEVMQPHGRLHQSLIKFPQRTGGDPP